MPGFQSRFVRSASVAFILAFSSMALAEDRSPAGHYVLEGVMETGSELVLEPNGKFHWYLVYGALDMFADGKWTLKDGKVVLTSERGPNLPEPGFDRLVLTREGESLRPEGKPGLYERVGPKPESPAAD